MTELEPADPPRIESVRDADGRQRIRLSGAWVLRALLPMAQSHFRRLRSLAADGQARWDLSGVRRIDAAGALLLWRSWGRRRPLLELREELEPAFAGLSPDAPAPRPRPPADRLAPLVRLGRGVLALQRHAMQVMLLAGNLVLDFAEVLRRPRQLPWREISANVHRTGAQALPVIALVGVLVGIVLSYLSGRQLQNYGADIYIVNILGVGIVRELGPLLAAILVAGRSGSSMTAQLGVMRVTEELDALAVMGISPTLRLVLPKVLALALTMPLLVLWCDVMALAGGMVAADIELGIEYRQFLHLLPAAMPIANLRLGICKGVLFGMLIATIACHFGLRVEPNTESLGSGTTQSVVASITVVILADAAIAVIFSGVGF